MNWARLFERAAEFDVEVDAVRDALARRRDAVDSSDDERRQESADGNAASGTKAIDPPTDPSPARIVADADVLAADVLVGGAARAALENPWRHSFVALVASDELLSDAEATIAAAATTGLASDWRTVVEEWREPVAHPAGDHPGLASAYRGGAMHLLSFDEGLTSARAGAAFQGRVPVSVREPRAFATLFDAESLYAEVVGGEYPGPDRPPRA
ncbi:MAG: hypothetical protein V5A46_09710 [Haloferacaceae archaeon]